jgi:hypothetical protein
MAISADEGTLYPMLEGALEDDQETSRRYVYEFDLGSKSYTGERWWYSVEAPDNSIGDFTALGGGRFLVIERDNEQGEEAGFKKVYEVDLDREDSEGYLVKREVLDLLSIRDLTASPSRAARATSASATHSLSPSRLSRAYCRSEMDGCSC